MHRSLLHALELRTHLAATPLTLSATCSDADVVFVHARSQEEKFVGEGHGVKRVPVMYNDFVLIGPKADPAKVVGGSTITQQTAKLLCLGRPFDAEVWDAQIAAKLGADEFLEKWTQVHQCHPVLGRTGLHSSEVEQAFDEPLQPDAFAPQQAVACRLFLHPVADLVGPDERLVEPARDAQDELLGREDERRGQDPQVARALVVDDRPAAPVGRLRRLHDPGDAADIERRFELRLSIGDRLCERDLERQAYRVHLVGRAGERLDEAFDAQLAAGAGGRSPGRGHG